MWHFAPKVNIRCTWWWLCLPRYFNDLKGHFEICRLYKIQNYVPFITWYFTSAKCFTSLGKRLKKRKRIHNWSLKFKASTLRALSIIDNWDFYLKSKILQIFGLFSNLNMMKKYIESLPSWIFYYVIHHLSIFNLPAA